MPYTVDGKLVVAISSRALFDFEEENRIFDRDGEAAYVALQLGRLDVPAREGVAFPLVKKLLAFSLRPPMATCFTLCIRASCPCMGLSSSRLPLLSRQRVTV